MTSRADEQKCADLIALARDFGPRGGTVIADPTKYTEAEVRTANESVKRLLGDRFSVISATITFDSYTSGSRLTVPNRAAVPRRSCR